MDRWNAEIIWQNALAYGCQCSCILSNYSKWFDVYTDASEIQLGTCIIQERRSVAYFLQKLTKSQQNYTTMEKEMLSIVATLKEFWSMLLGVDIHVLRILKTWHSQNSQNATWDTFLYKNWNVFTHPTLHWEPPQHSSRRPFKAILPSYTGSDRREEETRSACRGF